nr:hypothetical protein Iba_chr13bCG2670 [Ipomoea batatas]
MERKKPSRLHATEKLPHFMPLKVFLATSSAFINAPQESAILLLLRHIHAVVTNQNVHRPGLFHGLLHGVVVSHVGAERSRAAAGGAPYRVLGFLELSGIASQHGDLGALRGGLLLRCIHSVIANQNVDRPSLLHGPLHGLVVSHVGAERRHAAAGGAQYRLLGVLELPGVPS